MAEIKSSNFKQQSKDDKPEKKIEKVVSGQVTIKKKSELRKFVENFLQEDISNVRKYAVEQVIIPTIRSALFNIITNGAGMFIYGSKGMPRNNAGSKIPYSSMYSNNTGNNSGIKVSRDYDLPLFDNRGDAEYVYSEMINTLKEYGMVKVSDLYDLCGMSRSYTDTKYGWNSLTNSSVEFDVMEGKYIIRLPRPSVLDR